MAQRKKREKIIAKKESKEKKGNVQSVKSKEREKQEKLRDFIDS